MSVAMLALPERGERCETCRFWESASGECHRHAPAAVTDPKDAQTASARAVWPLTLAQSWCGDWADDEPEVTQPAHAKTSEVAAHLLISKLAPFFNFSEVDLVEFTESLLDQLQPGVRRVIVHAHGLDGQALRGLKAVCRELKMSQSQVRALLSAGEERLEKALRLVSRTEPR